VVRRWYLRRFEGRWYLRRFEGRWYLRRFEGGILLHATKVLCKGGCVWKQSIGLGLLSQEAHYPLPTST
jgi:hypothetical protein